MAKRHCSRATVIAIAASVGLHAVWLAHEAKAGALPTSRPAEVIFEAYEAPPPPKVEEKEETPKPIENAKPEAVAQKSTSKAEPTAAPPPAAAQAGKTLTAPDDEETSLADFTMVQGVGTAYVGGTTSNIGTSQQAVRGVASNKPVAARVVTGQAQAPSAAVDATQRPRPLGNDWNCSRLFPNDPEAGDAATVSIVVTVGLDGRPSAVTVLRDPGHGFGAAARACALSQRFSVGLDRMGQKVASSTPPITVRFTR